MVQKGVANHTIPYHTSLPLKNISAHCFCLFCTEHSTTSIIWSQYSIY